MAEIADRLKAPATLEWVGDPEFAEREATLEDYRGTTFPRKKAHLRKVTAGDPEFAELNERFVQIFKRMDEPTLFAARYVYDAQNSFGVPLRMSSECTIVTNGVIEPDDVRASKVMVDGFNSVGWAIYRSGGGR